MTFFHFTSDQHLPIILASGFLKTVESNCSYLRQHAGPDVVWLLDQDEPAWPESGSHGLYPRKRQIRFEVDVPAIRWLDWQWTQMMNPEDKRLLIDTGGGIEAAEHWHVFPARIPQRRWVSIIDTATGEEIAA